METVVGAAYGGDVTTDDTLEQRAGAVVDRTVAMIFDEVPAYGAAGDPGLRSEVRGHVADHHRALVRCVAEDRRVTAEDLLFVRPHIVRLAAVISAADYARACRVHLRVAMDVLLEEMRARAGRVTPVTRMVGRVVDHIDRAATYAAEVYVEVDERELAGGEAVRRDLLEDLIASRPPAPGPRQEAARAAGLEPARPCVVAVAVPRTRVDDAEDLSAVAGVIARACRNHRTPLAVVRRGSIVLVATAGGSRTGEVVDALTETSTRLGRRGVTLAIGVSSVLPDVTAVASGHDEAWRASRSLGPEGGVLALTELSAFEYLTGFQDATAERLISPAVRRFVERDRRGGGVLAATLLAYAASNLSVKALSERLRVHVNTAHYRLARIAEQAECDLRRLPDVLELVIAIRLSQAAGDRPPAVPT
jgi:PucR C-terminal helix-turn-helix domain/GGDEF-like domain